MLIYQKTKSLKIVQIFVSLVTMALRAVWCFREEFYFLSSEKPRGSLPEALF